jgi:hypothetical protein
MRVLRQALDVATNFTPPTQDEIAQILLRTAEFAADGKYELYKTATGFDGTTHHPGWLG